jgi:hypothetical protein
MSQLIHPLFGDLMFDGVGLLGCVFVLVLMWDAGRDWKRARAMRDWRKTQLPYSTGRRRAARSFFRKYRGRLVLLVMVSAVAAMLMGGRQNPHGDKASPAMKPGTGNLPGGNDSNRVDAAILTFQTLPPPGGARGSAANSGSNIIAPASVNNPDTTNDLLTHP